MINLKLLWEDNLGEGQEQVIYNACSDKKRTIHKKAVVVRMKKKKIQKKTIVLWIKKKIEDPKDDESCDGYHSTISADIIISFVFFLIKNHLKFEFES